MSDKQELLELLKQANEEQTKIIKAEIKCTESNLTKKFNKQTKQIQKIEERCIYLERKVRKNNVIIFGVEIQDKNNVPHEIIQKLNELLQLSLTINDVNNIYPIGRSSTPPIIVEFITYFKKLEIFRDVEKLRALKGTKVSISNDLCEKDRQDQKVLRKHLVLARANNKDAKIRGRNIEIDKKIYSVAELEELISDSENTESEDSEGEEECEGEADTAVGKSTSNRTGSSTSYDVQDKGKRKRNLLKSPSPLYMRTTRNKKKR